MLSIFSSKNNVNSVKKKLNKKIETPTNLNNQYFKNLPKKGMKKSKENENKVKSEYYKCIIYIFSLSLILLEIKGIKNIQKAEKYIDIKNSAIKKIQNHLDIIKKKNNSIYESIKIKYLSKLFNYNDNLFEKKFFQNNNELASITLKIRTKNEILIILNDYDIFNSNQIFYKIIDNDFDINKVIWNNKNPDLFSINNFIVINYYDSPLKSGSYGSVYMINGIENRILKITDINRKNNNYNKKKSSFINEYNGLKMQKELTKLCELEKSVCKIFDYGILERKTSNNTTYQNELFCIMEKGLFDLNKLIRIRQNNNNDKELVKFLIQIAIKLLEKIKCIHDKNILHLDIKPDNIILVKGSKEYFDIKLSENLKKLLSIESEYILIKYIDFGLSTRITEDRFFNKNRGIIINRAKGSPSYAYMNIVKKNENNVTKFYYSRYSDLYSISIIILEFIVKNLAITEQRSSFKKINDTSYIKVINDKDIDIFCEELKINKSEEFKKLIKNILPDKEDNIRCIIEKDNKSIKRSNKTKLPLIIDNCEEAYKKNLEDFYSMLN